MSSLESITEPNRRSPVVALQGNLQLRAEARPDGLTYLAEQRFAAPFHVSKPYWDHATRTLLVQVVNPTAGIFSGDRLRSEVQVGEGAALLVTTPSASRVFCMRQGAAMSEQRFEVASGGWLEVWPEPLVPHRGSSFRQRTVLDLNGGGAAFFTDLLMVGRAAHGEAWAWDHLELETEVRVDGQLALRERFAQSGESLRVLAKLAGAGNSVTFANSLIVLPAAARGLQGRDELEALQGEGVWLGVSPLRVPGAWSVKIIAADGIRLRQVMGAMRRILVCAAPHLATDARKL